MEQWYRFFRVSAGVVCLVTGSAKVLSTVGSAGILKSIDPVFGWQIGHLVLMAGIVELVVAGVCLLYGKQPILVTTFVAWLATILLAYRVGLWWMDWHRTCHCLGNITDAIHVSPVTADDIIKLMLAYLLIGSYATLFWLWRQRKKASASTLPQ